VNTACRNSDVLFLARRSHCGWKIHPKVYLDLHESSMNLDCPLKISFIIHEELVRNKY
jgi:hypothetical protein